MSDELESGEHLCGPSIADDARRLASAIPTERRCRRRASRSRSRSSAPRCSRSSPGSPARVVRSIGRGYDESEAKAGRHALGQPGDVDRRLRCERGKWGRRLLDQKGVRGVLDDEKSVPAGDRHQSIDGTAQSSPTQAGCAASASCRPRGSAGCRTAAFERVQIGSVGRRGQRRQLKAVCFGEHLESRIGQRINRDRRRRAAASPAPRRPIRAARR